MIKLLFSYLAFSPYSSNKNESNRLFLKFFSKAQKMNYLKNELDLVSGVYKCYGDVDNLKFKIRLEMIKSSMIPLSSVEDQDNGLDPQYYEREELEFSWNEKVFSDREYELYKDQQKCTTHSECEYHERIIAMYSEGKKPSSSRLFTYTSKDHIPAELQRNVFCGNNANTSFSKSPLHSSTQRKLNSTAPYENIVENRNVISGKNIVDYNPSDLQRRRNRSLSSDYEIMYIVADLSEESKKRERQDYECTHCLLFTIMWNKRTLTLSVMPDFAAFSTPGYKIDIDKLSDARYVYRYWLMNMASAEDQACQSTGNVDEEMIIHHGLNFDDFKLPAQNFSHLFTFIELQKIQGFLGETLFVQYFIHLPSKWSAENPEALFGLTHQCRPRKCNNTAFFSCIFEVNLSLSMTNFDEETHEGQPLDVPQLFFEVGSLDSWKSFQVEGYAWMPLPVISGYQKVVLNSWRPVSLNLNHQLRRFFIGADYEIADIEYCGRKFGESNLFARYGFDTMSSGRIHLAVNSVRQTCSTTTKPKRNIAYSLNSWKTNQLMNNVNQVLEAFKKARQRMLSARELLSVSNK